MEKKMLLYKLQNLFVLIFIIFLPIKSGFLSQVIIEAFEEI